MKRIILLIVCFGVLSASHLEAELIAHWDFDEGSGNVVSDKVGQYVGMLEEGAEFTEDRGGSSGIEGDFAVSIFGRSVKVENAGNLFLNELAGGDEMTISFWQKLIRRSNSSAFWAESPIPTDGRGIQAHTPRSNGMIFFDTGRCCEQERHRLEGPPPKAIENGKWYHFAFVKRPETKEVWANGSLVLAAENTDPLVEEFGDLLIGNAPDRTNTLQGSLDDFAVYRKALDESFIMTLANGESPDVSDANLLAYWNFNDVEDLGIAPDGVGGYEGLGRNPEI
jgi:hypothetical protein